MTTTIITIQKDNMIILPKEWLQRFQTKQIEASIANGNIVLSNIKSKIFNKKIFLFHNINQNINQNQVSSWKNYVIPMKKRKRINISQNINKILYKI